eukprot:CAMPEP_0169302154 /NCGR_PEP_ID=MMETSP1016-20121227/68652_1 /TAXON_ID=342587 /ORGANISM="Karlodinium micrum, Strain CCMP2283" /LENGTH=237 /DNA_ID=CAMNT_0009394853 /DNA_START=16 /DNA_END=730 /DNA_ORIENTATION=-
MGNGSPTGETSPGRRITWCCRVESEAEIVNPAVEESVNPLGEMTPMMNVNAVSSSSSHVPLMSVVMDTKKSSSDAVDDVDGEATTADTNTPTRNNSQSHSRVPPQDFSGSWLCVAVSGDMEAFLIDMGLPEGPRKAASAARYGALRQDGDSIVVENILDKPVTMRFEVGEGVQRTADQDGRLILVHPVWDGEVLCVTSKRESGDLIANSRRLLEADSMVLELSSPSGTVVEEYFSEG